MMDPTINVLDENAANTILNKRQRHQILNMLKICFPLGKFHHNTYFHSPHQRIISLYKMKNSSEVEFIAVCFLQQTDVDKCFIHSVCVNKGRRGQKCCDRLFSYLVGNYGHYELSLYVRTDKYSGKGLPANKAAIRCYHNNGFLFVENDICTIHVDGLNCKMIRPKNTFPIHTPTYR